MEDITMSNVIRTSVRAERTETEEGKLSTVITYESSVDVAIPINKDGSIKWLDDSLFMKKS